MTPPLIVASLGMSFLASHLVLSHPPVRSAFVRVLGLWPFRGLYSLISLGFFVPWLLLWWRERELHGRLWDLSGPAEGLGVLLGLLGLGLIVAGTAQPAASSLTARSPEGPLPVSPLARVTRHPLNLGIAHWATAHLLVTPSAVDAAFFGPLWLTAILGLLHQDWRKKRESQAYRDYAAATSILPNPSALLDLDNRSIVTLGIGVVIAIVLYSAHPVVFGPPGE